MALESGHDVPLVSIGIPTFNRLNMLVRAVESVLAQDYRNIEVVISDNASTDGTQAWCEALAERDGRVRYVRQPINLGATANFVEVFRQARGRFCMVLGDDDWLAATYVSRCSQALIAQPELSVVCGIPRMFLGSQYLHDGRKVNLLQSSPARRVMVYLWEVGENVPFHGLLRREVQAALPPLPNVVAGDWLYVAWLAFVGNIQTLDDTWINRSVTGTTGNWAEIISRARLPAYWAKIPYLLIMGIVVRDIAWDSPVYAPAGRLGRVRIACLAMVALLAKFTLWSVAVVAKRVWYRFTTRPFPLRAK